MKASDFDEKHSIECHECGKVFHDKLTPDNRMHDRKTIPAARQLAGHIMRSPDHKNKKWARNYLLGENVGTGLWGDKGGAW
jgi:ATP-dependent Zn protease